MTYEFSEQIRAFLQEKRYLQNVSPSTIILYESCFKAFEGATDSLELVKARVVALRDRGISPVTANTYLRHIKCFYLWQGKEWKLPWLKEEQKILGTFTKQQVQSLIAFKPDGTNETRAQAVAMLILDCGLRINEARMLMPQDIALENMLVTVHGKGGKDRKVPFSFEMRRIIYRHLKACPGRYVFGTSRNTACTIRNLQRDFKALCKRINITLLMAQSGIHLR